MSARPDRDLSELLDEKVYPALHDRLDSAFPEYRWRRVGNVAWVARECPEGFPAGKVRPDRLTAYANSRHGITVHGGGFVRFLDLVAPDAKGAGFVPAVRRLCDLAGVPFPERRLSPEAITAARLRDLRGEMLEAVASHCAEALRQPRGAIATEYLKTRGVSPEVAEEFGLGLYPAAGEVEAMLVSKGYTAGDIAATNVAFAPMEGRVVFPWRDDHGRLSTLYGRWPGKEAPNGKRQLGLPGEGSKRSPLYLDRALHDGGGEVVLVEGLFDALVLQAMGDLRVVATGGGAVTGDQVETLRRRRVATVYIVGDPDKAGDEGAATTAIKITAAGLRAFVSPRLPDGLDPDEFVIRHGPDAWYQLLGDSVPGVRHLAERIAKGITPESPEADRRLAIERGLELCDQLTGDLALLDAAEVHEVLATATGYDAAVIAAVERTVVARRREERAARNARNAIAAAFKAIDESPDRVAEIAGELRSTLGRVETSTPTLRPYTTDAMEAEIRALPDGRRGGFGAIDDEVVFRPGELALVAARPGHAKTSALVHLLHRWAVERSGAVVFISYEETAPAIYCRLVARLAKDISPESAWTTAMVRDWIRGAERSRWGDADHYHEAIALHRELEEFVRVIYAPRYTVGGVVGLVHDLASTTRVSAVLTDYLQKVKPDRGGQDERRDIQVTAVASALRNAGVELRVPVVAGVQVNREAIPEGFGARVRGAKDHAELERTISTARPQLHHLREGGSEPEADLVLGLLNYDADNPKDGDTFLHTDRLDVGVLKNRYGRVGRWEEMTFAGGASHLAPRGAAR